MDVEVSHDIHIVQKEGFNLFNITGVRVKFEMEGLKMRLNNLFNGVKQLGEFLIYTGSKQNAGLPTKFSFIFQRKVRTRI